MTNTKRFTGCPVFDGNTYHAHADLIVRGSRVIDITATPTALPDAETITLNGGLLVPGFVDLQVNGGGGVLFNDQPTVAGIARMCAAHLPFGTTAMLATLITDTPEITRAAIDAGIEAHRTGVPGFAGLHLEGPHLDVARKGAHDPALIRPMTASDLDLLVSAAQQLPHLMVTVASGSVTTGQISALANAGIVVSLGHTDATCDQALAALDAGATCVTHLFNAMSPLSHRQPGVVGAALASDNTFAGLIADGFHVDKTAMKIAIAAKQGHGRIFLVTDAMSTIGTDLKSFTLNGRTITRNHGKLTLDDGTLAGADLDMITAIRYLINDAGIDPHEVLRMASCYPARCLNASDTLGVLHSGAYANVIHLDDSLTIQQIWQNGEAVFNSSVKHTC